jgi:hypothetical protein
MKILLTTLCFLFIASISYASPFLVCDPSAQAIGGGYEVWENGVMLKQANNELDGSIKMDLKDISIGTHTITARYFMIDPKWGTVYSAYSVPFTFTRPSLAAGNIVGLKLVP